MGSPTPVRARPLRPWRRFALAISVAAIGLAAGAWFLRDVPRKQVARVLGERLGADVRLGRLVLLGPHEFVLRDLEIRRLAGAPLLELARVERLAVRGDLRDILAARFEEIAVDGLEIRLAAPPPGPLPAAGPPSGARARTVRLGRGRLVIAGPGDPQAVEFGAAITGFGTSPVGTVFFRSPSIDAAPIAVLVALPWPASFGAGLDAVDGEIRFDGSRASVALRARSLRLAIDGATVVRPAPASSFEIRGLGGPLTVAARATVPGLVRVAAEARIDAAGRPVSMAARIEEFDTAPLAPFVERILPGAVVLARGTGTIGRAGDGWSWSVESAVPRAALAPWSIADADLVASGSWMPTARGWSAPVHAAITVRGLAGPSASLAPDWFPVTLDADGTLGSGPPIAFEGRVRAGAPPVGELRAAGSLRGARADARWSWRGARIERLLAAGRQLGWPVPPALSAAGDVEAEGAAAGPWNAPTVSIDARARNVEARGVPAVDGLAFEQVDGRVTWTAPAGPVRVRRVDATGRVGAAGLAPLPVTLHGSADLDVVNSTVDVRALGVASPGLFAATIDARLARGAGSADVEWGEAALPRWRETLAPRFGDPFPQYRISGAAGGRFSVSWDRHGWHAAGALAVSAAGVASTDGSRVVDGMATTIDVDARGGYDAPFLAAASAAGRIGGVQLLWGSLFADLSTTFADARAGVAAAPGGWDATLELGLPGGARLAGTGERRGKVAGARIGLRVPDLAATYDALVRGPLGDGVAFLDGTSAAGSLDIAVDAATEPSGPRVAGRVTLSRGALSSPSVEVAGLAVDAPFDLRWTRAGDALEPGGPPLAGRFEFERLAAGGFVLPPIASRLDVRADTVAFAEPLTVPLYGGQARLEQLTFAEMARPSRHLECGLRLVALDLAEIMASFGSVPLEGRLSARFPRVALTAETFRTEGEGTVDLFGGRIDFGEISGQQILSRYPKMTFSASFSDIDLGLLTRTFDFGEMTGVVEGWVRPMELFGSVPTRFHARVRTVEKKGVPRTINVKAINNVAVLGTGGRVTVFDRGLQRFFKRYTYDALGVEMILADDAFRLTGLERRGGKELFLKGRLPLPIDIVNAQPGRAVSFRSMIDRFKAVDFRAASTAKPAE